MAISRTVQYSVSGIFMLYLRYWPKSRTEFRLLQEAQDLKNLTGYYRCTRRSTSLSVVIPKFLLWNSLKKEPLKMSKTLPIEKATRLFIPNGSSTTSLKTSTREEICATPSTIII